MTLEQRQKSNGTMGRLASLNGSARTILREAVNQPNAIASEDIVALKKILADERARLVCSADAPLTTAKHVLKALRLNLLFHEIDMFVETENSELIAWLFLQTEAFAESYWKDQSDSTQGDAPMIASLSKRLRVKSYPLHQLPCTSATTIKRVELMQKYLTPTSRILCIGDDDFVSVALALRVPNEITVCELDPQIINLVERVSKELHLKITCRKVDIRKSWPEDLNASFDMVVTDPIYSIKEMLLFLSVAEFGLRKSPASYLLSCCSSAMAGEPRRAVEQWAASRGLVIHELFLRFNEYPKTARIRIMLKIAERLLLRSPVSRACASVPFIYSDLIVFQCQPKEKGGKL